jgi:hypothetical protein
MEKIMLEYLREKNNHTFFCQSKGIVARSVTAIKRTAREDNIISPPYFSNSFGIPSGPTAFREMLRENKSRRNPTHFIDTVDKTTLIENKAKIEKCLAKHFRDTGNKFPTKNMFSLEMKRPSIENILKESVSKNIIIFKKGHYVFF